MPPPSGDRRFRGRLIAYLRGKPSVGEDAEDIVQEAYARLEAWQQAGHGTVKNSDRFLWRTALNLAASNRRKAQVRDRAHIDQAVSELLRPSAEPAADEVIEMRERLHIVEAAINELPDRCRAIFVACRIEGMSYSQAARAYGISQSAVEKHMARAITHMTIRVKEFAQARNERHHAKQ